MKGLFTDVVMEEFCPPLTRPLQALDIMAHYSFDYAQQVIQQNYYYEAIIHLLSTFSGALSIKPSTARPHLFSHS